MFAVCIYLWYLLHQGVLKMFMQLILNLSFDKINTGLYWFAEKFTLFKNSHIWLELPDDLGLVPGTYAVERG